MPTSAEPNGTPSDKPGKSRLEREIEEILQRAERDNPLPPPTPIEPRLREQERRKALKENVSGFDLSSMTGSVRRWLDTAPLLVAFAAAILALMVRNVSPFLATIAATFAVVALFWPIVTAARGPRTPEQMWRGQRFDSPQEPPEVINRIRAWLRDRDTRK